MPDDPPAVPESPRAMTVERFMAEALYAAGRGYYMRPGRRLGRGGDFSTSATLHPALGTAIFRWATALGADRGGRLALVEVGAGGGHLAASLLDTAGWRARRRIDYRVVEISPALEDAQRRRLEGRRVRWFRTLEDAVRGVDRPLVFSNELVDAFPCRQFERRGGAWHERLVVAGPRRPSVRLAPKPAGVATLAASALRPASWPGGRVPEGQIVEVHASYRRWLARAGKNLPGGAHLLTIDYGDRMPALYERRRRGTLRGYFRHQRLEGVQVFRHPGATDLTADVNFTDLESWGKDAGLEGRGFETQRSFLLRWLPPRLRARGDPALAFLLDEDGAGLAFKVLWQAVEG